MSILSALKTQQGSLRELAMLPQQQILSMAQMGQLDVSMVPVILNEKAQMVQQVANAQAMAQGTPPSVIEQAMMINAQADAANAPPAGLEALPVPDDMYSEQSMAGGGIVAFERGGRVAHFQNTGMVQFPRFEDLPRYQGDAVVPGSEMSSFFRGLSTQDLRIDPETGEPITFGEYMRRLDQRRARAAMPRAQAMSEAAAAAGPTNVQAPPAAPAAPVAAPVAAVPSETPVRPAAAPAPAPAPARKAPSLEDYLKEAKAAAPEGQAYAGLEKDIRESAEQRKADKEQSMWMRVAEAGFGMMSGTSPYAMVNVGQSLSAAMKGYADDLKEQKKLDREDRRLLADIEQARRAETLGQYDKAAVRYEKALDRFSEDERAALLRKTQENVARIGAANRPTPFQEYLQNPEQYEKFSRAIRPGFESAETAKSKAAVDEFNKLYGLKFMQLMNSKKPEDQQAAQKMLDDFMAKKGVGAAAPGRGATFLGYE